MSTFFLPRLSYRAFKRFLRPVDVNALMFGYGPIIGADAVCLYLFLVEDAPLHTALDNSNSFMHERILKICDLSPERFVTARRRLEAIGLVTTMIDGGQRSGDEPPAAQYLLQAPLSYEKFCRNEDFRLLLVNKITVLEYERNQLMTLAAPRLTDPISLTATFSEEFNLDAPVLDHMDIAREALKEAGIACGMPIEGSVVAISELAFASEHLNATPGELQAAVCAAALQDDSGRFYVCQQQLERHFARRYEAHKNTPSTADMFFSHVSEAALQQAVTTYEGVCCLRFTRELQKLPLDHEQTMFLQEMKAVFPDGIINAAISYAVAKLKGIFNVRYIRKVLATLGRNGINGALEAVHFLRGAASIASSSKQKLLS